MAKASVAPLRFIHIASERSIQIAGIRIESQALSPAAMLDDELKEDQTLARIGVPRTGVEMDVQLLVRFDEPKIRETRGMREAQARRDPLPTRVVRQVLIRSIFVGEHRIVTVLRQRPVQI